VPWDANNPLGIEPFEVAVPSDTPPWLSCHRHVESGVLMVSQPGTRNQEILKSARTADGREIWLQVYLRTPGSSA
jgi:hypothetical protein